jgi:septal ring factor EnvC (AmiA/AmiB activator)
MREPTASYLDSHATYVPAEFQHDFDVADCALDEQLEHLQRQYASAIRAASRARFELELLEKRADVQPSVIAQAKRQRSAAETRGARLMRAIDALEERLENE